MDRYARGDDAAFEEVYDRLAPRLEVFLRRRTTDLGRVEDVVQQTMLRIHRARGRFTLGARVLPWAFAIARRLLVDAQRRTREVLATTDDARAGELLVALDAPADDVASAKEIAARLTEELAKIPENQRLAFELIKLDGLRVAEAAEVLGTTVAAVKLRAHRAYEALRRALAELGVTEPSPSGEPASRGASASSNDATADPKNDAKNDARSDAADRTSANATDDQRTPRPRRRAARNPATPRTTRPRDSPMRSATAGLRTRPDSRLWRLKPRGP